MRRFALCTLVLLSAAPSARGEAGLEGSFLRARALLAAGAAAPAPVPPVGPAGPVTPQAPGDLAAARLELEKAIAQVVALVDQGGLKPEQELALYKALASARAALAGLERAAAGSDRQAKLDRTLAEARAVQKVMSAFFAEKGTFGYAFKRSAFDIALSGDVVLEEVIRRLPLRGVRVGGSVRIDPRQDLLGQFNALKAEYYGLLLEASRVDKSDRGLLGLAEWGRSTKVVYPGETFGTEILNGIEYAAIVR